jgi:hypothetical protein
MRQLTFILIDAIILMPMKSFLLILGRAYPAIRFEGDDEYQLTVHLVEALPTDRGTPPCFNARTNEGRMVRVRLDIHNDSLVMAG